jgi:uncharacterized protein (UPF0335 family)
MLPAELLTRLDRDIADRLLLRDAELREARPVREDELLELRALRPSLRPSLAATTTGRPSSPPSVGAGGAVWAESSACTIGPHRASAAARHAGAASPATRANMKEIPFLGCGPMHQTDRRRALTAVKPQPRAADLRGCAPEKPLDGRRARLDAMNGRGLASRRAAREGQCRGRSRAGVARSPGGGRAMTTLQVSAQKQLRQLIEQIERLEEEKKALSGDIRDKFAEAKGLGFDVKVMRKVISLRKKTQTERQEEDSILSVYLHALGMLDDGPGEQPEPVLDAAE